VGDGGWHLARPDGEVDLLEDGSSICSLVASSLAELNCAGRGFDHCVRISVPAVDVPQDGGKAQWPGGQSQTGEARGVAACALHQLRLGF